MKKKKKDKKPNVFKAQFRPKKEYCEILEEIVATIFTKKHMRATDVTVIATALGILGTAPIRRQVKVKASGEELIQIAMLMGREVWKETNARITKSASKAGLIN